VNLTTILDSVIAIPKPFRGALARALGLHRVDALIRPEGDSRSLPARLLSRLAVTYRVGERDLQQIPRSGPVVIVANHPFGILEGAVLATVLARVRPDVRFLANDLLSVIPEIREMLIPIDTMAGASAAQRNAAGWRKSIDFLQGGGCLVVFPAGSVSHFQARRWEVTDSQWHTAVARVVEAASRKGTTVFVVPIHIEGSNSFLFQTLGLIHRRVRTTLLARELLNKRNRLVKLRIGSPIASKKLLEIPTPREQTEYLRWRTYLLAARTDFKARTSLPLIVRMRRHALPLINDEINSAVLSDEIRALPPASLLTKAGDLEVYIAPADSIPNSLQEIGRLRELTFRGVGEGTGRSVDLDRFDHHYLHLFAWNAARNEIVGAYRLGGTDVNQDLYTATLFKYGAAFLNKLGPALELGRSFVRPEYQRGFAPLLALWKGIGAYIARNPRYKVLFGPVSISNQYQAVSRELMVSFLERHASLREWMGLISTRSPFKRRLREPALPAAGFDAEDLSAVVSDLEPTGAGIPVLLRQYLKLGGKLLGFNVDPEFSDVLDGLILVDLTKTEPRLLERYLGRAEASQFLAHHVNR